MFNRWVGVCILFVILLPGLIVIGADKVSYPPEVTAALDAAGNNRTELEKVLSHYASEEDSLKLQAASYLIANMEGHCYAT